MQWYEKLFENYAEQYDKESFTQGTIGECDFIEKELNHDKSLRVIDIGCGTGRHTIELTKRGYSVTGIDLSEAQLKRAREKASQENLKIEFLKHDARVLPFEGEFDVAIMMCEGAFSLMETDEMNFQILQNAAKALKSPGKFIFTTLNGLYRLFHSSHSTQDGSGHGSPGQGESFDFMTMRSHDHLRFTDDDGNQHEIVISERYYLPSEITWLLKSLGFHRIDIFGAKLGAFSREDRLSVDDFEMLVIAEK
ncbi:MAG TPA: class I SAM-dependent methyltransferase [Firmicutes bacterium]|jgi:2-polyprenyl-3-methyl-5-hydroxy-6-metoxy-1,4-benzoquinol methylase|nr:class I SAM-dependent methyltransferase [Bacillota bacterium]